jgi:hypothetical protein
LQSWVPPDVSKTDAGTLTTKILWSRSALGSFPATVWYASSSAMADEPKGPEPWSTKGVIV